MDNKWGIVASPRHDRWHTLPTPTTGGIAIFVSFITGVIVLLLLNHVLVRYWGLLAGTAIIFLVGLYDDIKQLKPQYKLLGEIVASSIAVFAGFSTDFFSPRIENVVIAELLNIALTYLWIIGITNAFNLIDNIDGLAAGIAIIASSILGYLFYTSGNFILFYISVIFVSSITGFLFFNFPPATIFMGDSGSLFLGFTLSILSIAREPQASNLFAVMGVPVLIFLIPIIDTTMVSVTRPLIGKSPMSGGKDHTSHRLIAIGLSEKQTLLILYFIAVTMGIAGIVLEEIEYWYSLVIVPILVILLALFAAYLAQVKIIDDEDSRDLENPVYEIAIKLTYKMRFLEVILDFFIISIAWYLAILISSEFVMNTTKWSFFLQTLPFLLIIAYFAAYIFGIYQEIWKYINLKDIIQYFKVVFITLLLFMGSLSLFGLNEQFEILEINKVMAIFFLGIFYLTGLIGSRAIFKLFDAIFYDQNNKKKEQVLIYSSMDYGELILDWLHKKYEIGYQPIGIVTDNTLQVGRQIHGVRVIGTGKELKNILEESSVSGIVVAELNDERELKELINICEEKGCWVKVLSLKLERIV